MKSLAEGSSTDPVVDELAAQVARALSAAEGPWRALDRRQAEVIAFETLQAACEGRGLGLTHDLARRVREAAARCAKQPSISGVFPAIC